MNQAGLNSLNAEIAALDSYLLAAPSAQAPDVIPPNERRAINAFLVLSHGELESFLEICFLDYASDVLVVDATGRTDAGLYQVVVKLAPQLEKQLKGDKFNPPKILETVPNLIKLHTINGNNGIKRANVKTLAHAVGLNWPDVEDKCPDLLNALDVLGLMRGAVAHTGTSQSQAGLAPQRYAADARDAVVNVTSELPKLIQYLGARPAHQLPSTRREQISRVLRIDSRQFALWWGQRPFLRRR